MLIEGCIRKDLARMMNNATGKAPKMALFILFDEIDTYLWWLKMLGASSENYSSILYQLIESCLSVNTKIWERNLSLTIKASLFS